MTSERTIQRWLDGAPKDVAPWRRRKHLRETLTGRIVDAAKSSQRLLEQIEALFKHPYYSFEPREDKPERDEQTTYIESDAYATVCIGGNGCLAPWQTVFDHASGRMRRVDEIQGKWKPSAIHPATGELCVATADQPWVKGRAKLFKWTLGTGESFDATEDHRVLTIEGWRTVVSAFKSEVAVLAVSPGSSMPVSSGLPPIFGSRLEETAKGLVEDLAVRWAGEFVATTKIVKGEFVAESDFYDIGVPGYGNYECAGVIHANSGKSYLGAMRTAEFLAKYPPPEKDTPYWIVGPTYEISCGTCWSQNLTNILPVEWYYPRRITWQNQNRNWPLAVPLKDPSGRKWEDPKRKNWVLQFKSYEQGRANMQAANVGGVWFTEQFPADIFEETTARLRKFMDDIPSPITLEFTPLDPAKSIYMESLYDDWIEGKLPDWQFCKFNTEEAAASGHVASKFVEQLRAVTSDEMIETRLSGAFASYEGVIYKGFNRHIHVVNSIEIPFGVHHARSIDWGSSEENAFVTLWGFKDSVGRWYIYDELYSTDQAELYDDRIEEIKTRHPWDVTSPFYGPTYAPPDEGMGYREFAAGGIPMARAAIAVYAGIESVRQALKVRKWGEPGLVISSRCKNLIRELRTYRWERSSGEGLNPKAARPFPLKKDDHAVDALRYLIHSDRDRLGTAKPSAIRVEKQRRPGLVSRG